MDRLPLDGPGTVCEIFEAEILNVLKMLWLLVWGASASPDLFAETSPAATTPVPVPVTPTRTPTPTFGWVQKDAFRDASTGVTPSLSLIAVITLILVCTVVAGFIVVFIVPCVRTDLAPLLE